MKGDCKMVLDLDQKEYWDGVAYKKEFTTPFQMDLYSKYISKDSKILDVGCGYGRTLNELYCSGYKNLYGIDFSKNMIERGKKQYPYINLKLKQDKSIEFEDDYFDSVIIFAVLTCIIDDNEQLLLINEIKRVLKPGGIIYINDFLLNEDNRNIKRYQLFHEKYGTYGIFELPEGVILRHHSKEWIEHITSGFEKIVLDKVIYTTMNGHKSSGFYFMGKNIK